MPTPFTATLQSWHDFYTLTGGASATLAGLMFVAMSLGSHLVNAETRDAFDIFVTPSIIYFVSTLLLAALMIIPIFTPLMLAAALFIAGVAGFGLCGGYLQ